MMNRPRAFWTFLLLLTALIFPSGKVAATEYRVAETLDIDTVPSWFPVGFCLLTHGQQQFVAYYNEKHQMIVARRQLAERQWQRVELPTKVGWDSHNYVTMAVDSAGDVHLAGNMHCVPLIYFRTRRPGDITTFERLPMTGQEEQRCTYPRFLNDADGNLLFTYRSGSSGNGRRFYNTYDGNAKTWSRFLETPLFDGRGLRNAYPHGPITGPDGLFHVVWVWRETPDCATNHDLSYARSRNLKHWETAGGQPVTLPMTIEQSELCVDPVPVRGGIINGCEKLVFDSQNRPTISYHKLDENGNMQVYVARFEGDQWKRHAITDWDEPIEFSGGGAMPFIGISLSGLRRVEPDSFVISYRHRVYGSDQIVLDEATLCPVERTVTIQRDYPPSLSRPTIALEGIRVKLASDLGAAPDDDTRYMLRWETLDANRDRPRDPPLPPPSRLQLVKLEASR
jgi:hypothetical protein